MPISRQLLCAVALLWTSGWTTNAWAACPRWMNSEIQPPHAVAIVAHGMNLKPDRMSEVAGVLQKAGVDVLLAGFSGHCGETDGFSWVDWFTFKADALGFYESAQARAKRLGVPLHLVAFSFSAPIFESIRAQAPFRKRVYMAPAFATHFWYPAIKLLTFLPNWFPIPSSMPAEYRATRMGRSQGTQALMDVLSHWQENVTTPARPPGGEPTLILMDPKDELVDYVGVEKLIVDNHWDHWHLTPISIEKATHSRPQHHRIIDRVSVGDEEWARMSRLMLMSLGL